MANGIRRSIRAALRAPHRAARLAGVAMAFIICLVPIDGLAGDHDRRDEGRTNDRAPLRGRKIPFADAKIIIEHNATDEDTGFQVFVDGEPWNALTIEGPGERTLLEIGAESQLGTLGLTELFFETSEPPNAEVPIEDLLAQFPEGRYEFEGRSVEGQGMTGTARLSHTIPAGPRILSPAEGDVVDPNNTVIRWEEVTESITGDPVTIVAYQVIVTKPVNVNPAGFSKLVLSVHVSASTTSLTVPREFLEPGTEYDLEVLALEEGGNQTISSSSFRTP